MSGGSGVRLLAWTTLAVCGCGAVPDQSAAVSGDPCLQHERCSPTAPDDRGPALFPIPASQRSAVARLEHCLATAIASDQAITAAHCDVSAGAKLCFELEEGARCVDVAGVDKHPELDLARLRLATEVASVAAIRPAVGPALSWFESVGYREGELEFAEARVVGVDPKTFSVSSDRGRCFGDSGGPALILGEDGRPAIAGVLSGGDPGCDGSDVYTRLDVVRAWLGFDSTLVTSNAELDCDGLDGAGRCVENWALFCDQGHWSATRCAPPKVCGFDPSEAGFRCRAGHDACAGYDAMGACEQNVATWCDHGVLRQLDCGELGTTCERDEPHGGAYCHDTSCGGLGWRGRCDGHVAEWCEDGEIARRSCERCGFAGERDGYSCL